MAIVKMIIDVVTIFGIVTKLPLAFLGLSLIAIWNWISDTVNNLTFSKKGHS